MVGELRNGFNTSAIVRFPPVLLNVQVNSIHYSFQLAVHDTNGSRPFAFQDHDRKHGRVRGGIMEISPVNRCLVDNLLVLKQILGSHEEVVADHHLPLSRVARYRIDMKHWILDGGHDLTIAEIWAQEQSPSALLCDQVGTYVDQLRTIRAQR